MMRAIPIASSVDRSEFIGSRLVLHITAIDLVRRIEATDRFKFCKAVPVGEVSQISFIAEPGTGYGKGVDCFDTVPDTSGVIF